MSAPPPPVATAIVVAGDEETRVLLRGLLRLHHFRVEGEAEGATQALQLVREHHPNVMVADVTLAEGSPMSLVVEARAASPHLRVILVAPASRPPPTPPEPRAAPDVLLLRPFRIREFAEALTPRSGPVAPVGETAAAGSG